MNENIFQFDAEIFNDNCSENFYVGEQENDNSGIHQFFEEKNDEKQ